VESINVVAPRRLWRSAVILAQRAREVFGSVELRALDEDSARIDGVSIVVGTDRDALNALRRAEDGTVIATVAPPGYSGYVASIPWDSVDDLLQALRGGEYRVREVVRLRALVDGRRVVRAVNEVAIFPQRSAVVMEYTLAIDGEVVWRDTADGVIVATPLGSTAYALSAGGPVVLLNAEVFVVVPVNSVDPRRRPLVVSQSSRIEIRDLASRTPIEVVADGIERLRVEESVEVVKGGVVRIVDLEGGHASIAKRKMGVLEELQSLPPSAKFVYKMLELEGPMNVKEISAKTLLPERTVRYALSILVERGLVERVPDPRDPRRSIYRVRGL